MKAFPDGDHCTTKSSETADAGTERTENQDVQSAKVRRRILLLVSSMQGGGAERIASVLCNHWVARGYEVTLMPTFSGRGGCTYHLDDRVRLDYLADYSAKPGNGLWSRTKSFFRLRQLIKGHEPDVVVSFLARVNVATILATTGLRVRVVVSERNNPVREELGILVKILRRRLYRYADIVVAQTHFAEQWIKRYCGARNTMVIPNPVVIPLPETEPVVEPGRWSVADRRLLLAVGRLVAQKDFECLIDAFATLADEFANWDLVIVGEGPLRSRLELKRDVLGLQSRIQLPGRVGNLGDWYTRADIYVMSSLYEGFPNTMLESLAYGLPVVSFDCESGPGDLVAQGVNGLLVPPSSGSSGLAEALRSLMVDDGRRRAMGEAASKAGEKYSMKHIGARWNRALGFAQPSSG